MLTLVTVVSATDYPPQDEDVHTAFLKGKEVSGLQSVVPMGNFSKHPDPCWVQHSRTQAN